MLQHHTGEVLQQTDGRRNRGGQCCKTWARCGQEGRNRTVQDHTDEVLQQSDGTIGFATGEGVLQDID